jgi:hypothetical protein
MSRKDSTYERVKLHLNLVEELVTGADDLDTDEVWRIRDRIGVILEALEKIK